MTIVRLISHVLHDIPKLIPPPAPRRPSRSRGPRHGRQGPRPP
jgi:hypothetical protein